MTALSPSTDDPLLRTRDLAKMFGIKEITVREWLRTGKLEGKQINGKWVVQQSAAIAYANQLYGS